MIFLEIGEFSEHSNQLHVWPRHKRFCEIIVNRLEFAPKVRSRFLFQFMRICVRWWLPKFVSESCNSKARPKYFCRSRVLSRVTLWNFLPYEIKTTHYSSLLWTNQNFWTRQSGSSQNDQPSRFRRDYPDFAWKSRQSRRNFDRDSKIPILKPRKLFSSNKQGNVILDLDLR